MACLEHKASMQQWSAYLGNAEGLRFENPFAVRALKKLLKTHCPDVVFLMETRLKETDTKAKSSLVCGPLSNLFMIDFNSFNDHRSGPSLEWCF